MAGVGVLSSLAVFLLVLLASFSAAREERPAGTAWTVVADTDQEKYNYLAVLKDETRATMCAGTIPSEATVLTYCTMEPSKAYAGLLKVEDAKDPLPKNAQFRDVGSVKKYTNTNLKICVLNNKWTLDTHVNVVPLHPNGGSVVPDTTCTVLGFREDAAAPNKIVAQMSTQTISSKKCNESRNVEHLLYSKVTDATQILKKEDFGGPAVTAKGELLAINMKGESISGPPAVECNTFVHIAKYSDWIKENTAQESGENQGPNANVTSTGSSIHGYMKKNSEWKVLGFLVPAIVTFLQY